MNEQEEDGKLIVKLFTNNMTINVYMFCWLGL